MASSDINRVVLIGRLTRDPEIRQIPSGTSITTFSIANNRVYMTNNEKREETSFFNCHMWGKGGEVFAKYAKKGQRISIDGRLQQRRWQDNENNNRSVIEIVVENFQFLSYSQDGAGQSGNDGYQIPDSSYSPAPTDNQDNSAGGNYTSSDSFSNDDLPF